MPKQQIFYVKYFLNIDTTIQRCNDNITNANITFAMQIQKEVFQLQGPLSNTVVLELSQFVAAPYAGSILASLGAEVIKIERPLGDEFRNTGPQINDISLPFQMLNHNKKSVVIDLKQKNGLEALYKLVKKADVLLESSRPGTMDRLGAGYENIHKLNPRLVYCSISGFGHNGPYRDRGGVDIVAQAMGGLMGITGEPGRAPVKVSYPITDVGAGMWAVIGILSALSARERTGEGQHVDTALLDTPIAWSIWEASRYFGLNEIPTPLGSSHRNVAPYRAYKCRDDRYIVAGVASQGMWIRFCLAIGAEELLHDASFESLISRRENRELLESKLEPIFLNKTSEEWLDILENAGVANGLVYRYDEALSDPQVQARHMIADVDHPQAGSIKVIDVPVYLSGTPRQKVEPAPALGEHSAEILRSAGLDEEEIKELVTEKVTFQN